MIWSIMPEELLFAAAEEEGSGEAQVADYLGRKVSLRGGRVEALLSSDPQDYLDQRLAPGAEITGH